MKFFNSMGPNPHIVRMYMAERGITMDTQEVDLMAGENRQPEHFKRNPSGQMPALELDDGSYLSEVTVIAEYLEEKNGASDLIGTSPEQRAETRMWTRKVDLNICEPMATGFRGAEGYDIFKDRGIPLATTGADDMKNMGRKNLEWLEKQMNGKDYLCGDRFSFADIHLFCWLAFLGMVGQPVGDDLPNMKAWMERVGARESAAA